ncbi:branched-chain amino acid transaminase [Actinomadura darangshiensis]|uniref:Branched-chain-amino-acid aminotransferase n=1 Tax=Actinomadura darangshiensis TaxID=705336 RepID=A0A4R5AWV3_9ACTN|nr:branched-chain amino acid transaminase [Actinomadura darangshiensis]TDD75664.1 branched-chain amino acid transaminase [Actinomadura darangshiensis]
MPLKSVWLDGELVPWDDATVHVSTLGLHYGIGFFEGIRCHATDRGRIIFRLADHLRRLASSAAIYGVELPYPQGDLARACRDVVIDNEFESCYLRPIVFLGQGLDPFDTPFRAAILGVDFGPLTGPPSGDGVTAKISSFRRMSHESLPPAAKATGQYLNAMLAQGEARAAGCDEAILLNGDGHVSDGWAHNVFAVRDGVLMTPPPSSGALPGITRDSMITLAAEAGIPVQEQTMVRTDLYLADECFLTGTSVGVVPVLAVDGRTIGTGEQGPVTGKLIAAMDEAIHGDGHPEWLESVE